MHVPRIRGYFLGRPLFLFMIAGISVSVLGFDPEGSSEDAMFETSSLQLSAMLTAYSPRAIDCKNTKSNMSPRLVLPVVGFRGYTLIWKQA